MVCSWSKSGALFEFSGFCYTFSAKNGPHSSKMAPADLRTLCYFSFGKKSTHNLWHFPAERIVLCILLLLSCISMGRGYIVHSINNFLQSPYSLHTKTFFLSTTEFRFLLSAAWVLSRTLRERLIRYWKNIGKPVLVRLTTIQWFTDEESSHTLFSHFARVCIEEFCNFF